MGKTGKLAALAIVAVGLAFASQAARADYVMDVFNDVGASAADALPGESFVADVELTGGDQFDSFGMWMTFDVLGLKYDDYTLGPSAFETRDSNDFTELFLEPVTDAITGNPYFSAVTRDGEELFASDDLAVDPAVGG